MIETHLELYREEVLISETPPLRLSYIDIMPENPIGTMVFVHGFGGHALHWERQLKTFGENYRVVAYDLRGHGRSEAPLSRYDMPEVQADLEALLEKLHVKWPFVLVGHSFGGAIVTEFARRHPEALSHLVLIATPRTYKLIPITDFALRLPLPVLQGLRRLAGGQAKAKIHVLKFLYLNTMSLWNGAESFPHLRVPTLVIRGEKDRVYPTAVFADVAKAIPDAEDVNIGVSRHMVPLERPDAVNRAIERFIRGQTESPLASRRMRPVFEAARPWVRHYDQGVPTSLDMPKRPLHKLLQSTVRRFGSRPAIVFAGRTLTYRALDGEINRLANALRSLGVDHGTRVMLLLPSSPQFVIAYYAILKAGGVVVSTITATNQDDIRDQVFDSGAELLITLTLFSKTARHAIMAANSPLRAIIFTNIKDYMSGRNRTLFTLFREAKEGHTLSETPQLPAGRREYLWNALIRKYPPSTPRVDVPPDALAVIQYTGGTTDKPKGVMLSHNALLANALQTRHWIPNLREGGETVLAVLPFSHAYGMTAAMNVPIALGAKIVILSQFVTMQVLEHIKRYRPTLFPGVPTMYTAINHAPNVRKFGIQSIKACISGAAPLPIEVQEAFEKLTKGRLVEGYGLTEAAPVTHANPLFGLRKVGTIGVPLPNTDAAILDLLTREPLPPGHIGELAIRGPQVMNGYWNPREDGESPFTPDGWLLTGDVARMDEDGFFQIVSRKKDMILAGPYQVYPRDVEEVLYEHPGVKEVAVVGLTLEDNGPQRVKAYVVPRPGTTLSAEELIALCRRRLKEYAVPWQVEFRQELPKNFVGKVLRRLLVEDPSPSG